MFDKILYLFDLDRFDSEQSEFLKYYVANSIKSIRYGIILATSLYSLFAILDLYMAPQTYHEMWIIRFVYVVPALIIFFIISFSPVFIRYSQPIMVLMFTITSLGIIIMVVVSHRNEPAHNFYFIGIILVTIGQHTVVRLKNELSLMLSIVVLICYNIAAVYVQKLHQSGELFLLINNNFFIVSSIVLGYSSARITEDMFRRDFFSKKELSDSYKSLDELNAIKSKLLSIIAHDLRGPMANTRAMLDLLGKGYLSDNEFRKRANQLLSSVNSASNMLENLLSWSIFQIENQKVVKQNVSLKELTDNVFNLLKPKAEEKLIQLVNSINGETMIQAQPTLVEIVIRNLVTNAIKFTERGKIEVKAILKDSYALVSIEDTGSGMPEEIANNLFNWNKKTTSLGTQRERGTGIGLLICKEFLEKHNGSISFKSELGKGTTFFFTVGMN